MSTGTMVIIGAVVLGALALLGINLKSITGNGTTAASKDATPFDKLLLGMSTFARKVQNDISMSAVGRGAVEQVMIPIGCAVDQLPEPQRTKLRQYVREIAAEFAVPPGPENDPSNPQPTVVSSRAHQSNSGITG